MKPGQTKQTQTRNVRVVLTGLGLLTLLLSVMVIVNASNQLRVWQGDPLLDASIVLLLLGILLAVGGSCLVLRGLKYQSPAT